MSAKDELLAARNEMMALLDTKLARMPEWRALGAIDKALDAIGDPEVRPTPSGTAPMSRMLSLTHGAGRSYVALALEALRSEGKPLPTPDIMSFIGERRPLGEYKKARINVQSALSKDERIASIPWRQGRAWWYADRDPPREETAGLPFQQDPAAHGS